MTEIKGRTDRKVEIRIPEGLEIMHGGVPNEVSQ